MMKADNDYYLNFKDNETKMAVKVTAGFGQQSLMSRLFRNKKSPALLGRQDEAINRREKKLCEPKIIFSSKLLSVSYH